MPRSNEKKAQLVENGLGEWQVRQVTSAKYENFSLQRHEDYEFYLHIRNGGVLQVDNSFFPLQPNQLFIIPPHCAHGLVHAGPIRDYQRLYLQVAPRVLESIRVGDRTLRQVVDECCRSGQTNALISAQEYLRLRTLASILIPAETVSTPLEHTEMLGYLAAMVSRICQLLSLGQGKNAAPYAPLMQAVYHYVMEHFARDCSLERLAEEFNISKFHLSHRFSETFGVSLHRFVLECRIAYAQHLIRQAEPLMTVFYRCGFNDYSSFVRAFSRITGVSPRAWRAQQNSSGM